ncbi:uncharacterized protein C8Q71DRAFT_724881 [Rhodofomes roseus]|uniref:Uncharacterized protein n=1 Tax=Rhodofomes roseus TaxID=34475 RepID=A0ABQ8KC63_9APHY|nr:uncharacterized protein C8Q71DRAFT_724881 [Rhodofomes roseus]KAH9834899.1 hypothetical protein C8Q71DRAFT_724881 [Rhodofomes roseus]
MRSLYHSMHIGERKVFLMLLEQYWASPRIAHWLITTRELYVSKMYEGKDPYGPYFGRNRKDHRFIHALPMAGPVRSLDLSYAWLNTFELRRIINAFPRLNSLSLHGNVRGPPHTIRANATQFQLEYLGLDLRTGSNRGSCEMLEELIIHLVDELLEAAGPSLLRYSVPYDLPPDYLGKLTTSAALRSLELCLGTLDLAGHPLVCWSGAAEHLHKILGTVRSDKLERIKIEIEVKVTDSISEALIDTTEEELDVQNLHEVMSRSYFNALKEMPAGERFVRHVVVSVPTMNQDKRFQDTSYRQYHLIEPVGAL